MRCRRRAVDRDLDAVDSKRREPVGGGIVDAAAVGFDLERNARRSEDPEQVPAMRDTERLAPAEGDIGDAGLRDPPCEREGFVAAKLVAPRLVRARTPRSRRCSERCSGWSAARQEKGAPGTHRPSAPALRVSDGYQVKRIYGCAMTCSDTSSSLGVSHARFWTGAVLSVFGWSLVFAVTTDSSCSLIFSPSDHTTAAGSNRHVLACA
jgi:hypothetical protein